MYTKKEIVFVLDAHKVDQVGRMVEKILAAFKMERGSTLKIKLAIEDLLIRILNSSSFPRTCRFTFLKRFRHGLIKLEYDGRLFNPLESGDDEFSKIMLRNMGAPCEWTFQNNTNQLTINLHKSIKSNAPALLAAIVAAVILGLCSRAVPESINTAASEYLITPFRSTYLSLLNSMAGILLFFSIIAGLCGDEDTVPLGKKGRLMLIRLPIVLIALTALSYLILLPFFNLNYSRIISGGESQAEKIISLLWGLVPSNVIAPFIDGNLIHVLIFALIFGGALSTVRERYPVLVSSVNGINNIVMFVTGRICRLIPLFVFSSLLNLIMTPGALDTLRGVYKPIVMMPVVSIILIIIVFIALGLKYRCRSYMALKAMLPAWLISIMTGSPIAAYNTNINILEDRLGVSKRFGLSISGKLYPMGVSLYLAVMVIYFAERYQIAVNIGWLVMALLLTIILTFAGPPVPGELLIIFGVLAKQLGFPEECLLILAAVDVLLDGIATGTSCILRNAELLFEAGIYKELDIDKLRKL